MARTPPLFVSATSSVFNTSTSPKAVSVAVQSGDLVVVGIVGMQYNYATTISNASGVSFSLQARNNGVLGFLEVAIYAGAAPSTTTLNLELTGGNNYWGYQVQVWRNHGGVGQISHSRLNNAEPYLWLTTAVDNSAVMVVVGDSAVRDGANRVWRSNGTAAIETHYGRDLSKYTRYFAYHPDVGTVSQKTLGLTTPSDQTYVIMGLEILGSTASVPGIPSQEAFGTPTLTYGDVVITPTGIPSAEAFGTVVLVSTELRPTGIPTEEAFGTPSATVDTWRQIIERDWWYAAITGTQRTIGYRAIMVNPAGLQVGPDVPLTTGTIDYDGDSAERWSCNLSISGKEWVPTSPTSMLDPRAGLRCRLFWRLLINNSWVEIPVGTYYLENPKIKDDGTTATISVQGRDAVSILRETGYGSTVVAVGGLTIPAALARIFQRLLPYAPVKIETTSGVTLPANYELSGDDPLIDLTNIASQAGLIISTDREGVIVCAPTEEPQTYRADWQEGPDCPVVGTDRGITTSQMLNSVTVVSTNPDVIPPVSVTVEDDDPSSPTFVNGPFRRRGTTIRLDSVATIDGATSFARAVLNSRRRPTENVTVEVPGRGDLNFMDQVQLHSGNAQVAGAYRIARWTLPITGAAEGPPTMTVTMITRSLI